MEMAARMGTRSMHIIGEAYEMMGIRGRTGATVVVMMSRTASIEGEDDMKA
jgi:hypothetical protein